MSSLPGRPVTVRQLVLIERYARGGAIPRSAAVRVAVALGCDPDLALGAARLRRLTFADVAIRGDHAVLDTTSRGCRERVVVAARPGDPTCPVAALRALREARFNEMSSASGGTAPTDAQSDARPLFVNARGEMLTLPGLQHMVKHACAGVVSTAAVSGDLPQLTRELRREVLAPAVSARTARDLMWIFHTTFSSARVSKVAGSDVGDVRIFEHEPQESGPLGAAHQRLGERRLHHLVGGMDDLAAARAVPAAPSVGGRDPSAQAHRRRDAASDLRQVVEVCGRQRREIVRQVENELPGGAGAVFGEADREPLQQSPVGDVGVGPDLLAERLPASGDPLGRVPDAGREPGRASGDLLRAAAVGVQVASAPPRPRRRRSGGRGRCEGGVGGDVGPAAGAVEQPPASLVASAPVGAVAHQVVVFQSAGGAVAHHGGRLVQGPARRGAEMHHRASQRVPGDRPGILDAGDVGESAQDVPHALRAEPAGRVAVADRVCDQMVAAALQPQPLQPLEVLPQREHVEGRNPQRDDELAQPGLGHRAGAAGRQRQDQPSAGVDARRGRRQLAQVPGP